MTNKRTTRRSLIASVLSLFLCITMLIGSTFAWFTDSASTGVNKITSGNLDVALYEGQVSGGAISYAAEVTPSTKLFDDSALWEPGYTEVAYLKVENKGSLALKYQLTVNVVDEIVGKSILGNDIKLSEVLKYDLVEIGAAEFFADRTKAMAAVKDAKNLETEVVTDSIDAKADAKYYAIIVYMPTDVDNKANHNGVDVPSIKLGVNLVAAQNTVENDSFDNQYDKNATYPLTAESEVVAGKDTVIKIQNAYALIPAEVSAAANATSHTLTVVEKDNIENNVTISGSGLAYDVEVSNISENNTEIITVGWFIGTGAEITDLYHDGVKMTEAETGAENTYSYDSTSGFLAIYVTHFSEFALDLSNEGKSGTAYYDTFEKAIAAADNGETLQLINDVKLDSTMILENKNIVIDGNGYTISGEGVRTENGRIVGFNIKGGDVTLKNMTLTDFDCDTASIGSVIKVESGNTKFKAENLTINNFVRDCFTILTGNFEVVDCNINCKPRDAGGNKMSKGFNIQGEDGRVTGVIKNTYITNANSTYSGWVCAAVEVYGNSDVEIVGSRIDNSNIGIYVDNAYGTPVGDVAVTVRETTVVANEYGSYIMGKEGQKTNKATLTFESGDITGKKYCAVGLFNYTENDKIIIKGGNFHSYIYPYYGSTYDGNITISGGTFYWLPSSYTEGKYGYIADGYKTIVNTDGTTSVVPE